MLNFHAKSNLQNSAVLQCFYDHVLRWISVQGPTDEHRHCYPINKSLLAFFTVID